MRTTEGTTKCNQQKSTRLQVMQGFLPTGMWQKQHTYYVYIRLRKQGITLCTKLCKKIIEATHLLWIECNSLKHNRRLHGLQEVEDI